MMQKERCIALTTGLRFARFMFVKAITHRLRHGSTGHQSPNIRGQFILRQNYSDRLRCNFAWLQLSFHSLKKLLQQHEGGDKDLVVGGRPHISSHYFANVLNGLSDVKESKLTGLVVDSALVWAGETITINLQLMQHKNRFSIYC